MDYWEEGRTGRYPFVLLYVLCGLAVVSIQRNAPAKVGGDIEILTMMNGRFTLLESALAHHIQWELPLSQTHRAFLLSADGGLFSSGLLAQFAGGCWNWRRPNARRRRDGCRDGLVVAAWINTARGLRIDGLSGTGGQEGDRDGIGEFLINGGAENNVRVFANAIDLIGDAVDLDHRQPRATRDRDQYRRRFRERV
jgi:hypothetical protein